MKKIVIHCSNDKYGTGQDEIITGKLWGKSPYYERDDK